MSMLQRRDKMEIKKIREDKYGQYYQDTMNEYDSSDSLDYMFSNLESQSMSVKVNGQTLNVSCDINKYLNIISKGDSQADKNIELSMLLYNDFKDVPINIMLDKYVWAYLNIKIFKDIIDKHMIKYRMNNIQSKNEEEKKKEMKGLVSRHYFSKVDKYKITRSGMRWLWYCAYKLNGERDYVEKAHKYIDPVRAMFERSFSNDVKVLKVYINFIEKLNMNNKKMLNSKERSTVATHINCVGAVSRYATFEKDELMEFFEEQAKYIME